MKQTGGETSEIQGMRRLHESAYFSFWRKIIPTLNWGKTCVFSTRADGHGEVSQESLLSKNATTSGVMSVLSTALSGDIFPSYTYNRYKGLPL